MASVRDQAALDVVVAWRQLGAISGGLNNAYDPREIGQGQVACGLNMDLSDPTRARTRNGTRRLPWGRSGITGSASASLGGMAELNAGSNSRLLTCCYTAGPGAGLYYQNTPFAKAAAKAVVTQGPGPATSYPSDFSPGQWVSSFQGNDLLFIMTPGANVHALTIAGELIDAGSMDSALPSQAGSPPSGAVDGVYLLERPWLLVGSRVYYGKLLVMAQDLVDATVFSSTNYLTLSPEREADPRAIKAWRDSSLIVFFAGHVEQVTVNSQNPLLSSRQVVNSRLGTLSPRTAISVGDEVFFLDQYSKLRSLQRTTFGTLKASEPLPLSEPIKGEFPARCRPENWHKTWMEWHDSRLYIHYCRDGSSVPNASVSLIMPPPYGFENTSGLPGGWRWDGPWVYPFGVTHGISSGIGPDGRYRYYAVEAGPSTDHLLYEMHEGGQRYDDGEAIEAVLETRMDTVERERRHTVGRWGLTFDGDTNANVVVSVRTNPWQDFIVVGQKRVDDVGSPTFPISFPMNYEGSFPFVYNDPRETRLRRNAPEESPGISQIPSGAGAMPAGGAGLPMHGPGLVPGGRGVQWRLSCGTPGARFEVEGLAWEVTAPPAAANWTEED